MIKQNFHRSLLAQIYTQQPLALILIGGCARVGKTTGCQQIMNGCREQSIPTLYVPLDAWIVSVEKRPVNSTVLDRYEGSKICEGLSKLLKGQTIYPPVYDPITRTRVKEKSETPLFLGQGLIFAEGVMALAYPELRELATLCLYLSLSDSIRLQRLSDFYLNQKGFTLQQAQQLIEKREQEEIPVIKKTQLWADYVIQMDDYDEEITLDC